MIRAGTPATTDPDGTDFVTTAPAATITLSPIVTPGITIDPAPMKQSLPTLTAR